MKSNYLKASIDRFKEAVELRLREAVDEDDEDDEDEDEDEDEDDSKVILERRVCDIMHHLDFTLKRYKRNIESIINQYSLILLMR